MCHFRRVRNFYTKCGHADTLPEEEIKCTLLTCKFSPCHPIDCQPPSCSDTCWQYRQYPEQYSPHVDKLCPNCSGSKTDR